MRSSVVSYVRFLWGSVRWQLAAAIILSALLSLTEGISLAMVYPVIALLGDHGHPFGNTTSATGLDRSTRLLFHLLEKTHIPSSAWLASLLVVVLLSVGLLSQFNGVLTVFTTSLMLRVRRDLGARAYESILHADWSYLARRRSSDLTHALTSELDRVSAFSASIINAISNGMVGLVMLGVAVYLAPMLALALVGFFLLLLPWQKRTGRRLYRAGEELSTRYRDVYDSSMERLQNLKVAKAYGAQDAELQLFRTRYLAVTAQYLANEWTSAASGRVFELLSMVLVCVLILVGLGPLHIAGGTMLIFLFAFMRAVPRLNQVQNKSNEILADFPAYRNIEKLIAECEEHTERGSLDAPAPTLQRELSLDAVTFAYAPDSPVILDGASLTLEAGRITAIAGLSGAGKSTVADLVMGLLYAQAGEVRSDGVAITRSNARAWRRHVGYVSQDTLLFHASIRDNLLWAQPGATDVELAEAIAEASAGFIFGLAQGIHTVVGDRGMMLSHGQRQRIALARALLLKPTLLILDEATNSLDLENERNILTAVQQRGPSVTTLLISHRPSAVLVADRVYVLEGGRVRLSGSWESVRGLVEAQADESTSTSDEPIAGLSEVAGVSLRAPQEDLF